MKKWRYVLLAVVVLGLLVACSLWYRSRSNGEYGWGKDDACVKETIETYKENVKQFESNLQARRDRLEEKLHPQAAPRTLQSPSTISSGIPPEILISLRLLLSIEQVLRSLECTAMPMPVQPGAIGAYPNPTAQKPLPPPCEQQPIIYKPEQLPKEEAIKSLAKSVGRIEIRNMKSDVSTVAPVMLGTGFVIARNTFAVSCHIVAPLLLKTNSALKLDHLDESEKLVVDFEVSRQSLNPDKEFEVTGFLDCSKKNGLDVALLEICPRSGVSEGGENCGKEGGMQPPDPLPLLLGGPEDIKEIKNEFSIVLGYPDFDHFIDPLKRAIYDPWIKDVYGKFLLIDGVEDEDDCDKDLGIVLDTVSTTVGESGSVVIDLHEPVLPKADASLEGNGWRDTDGRNPVVVGMHTCCSAYFEKDYAGSPQAGLPCARLRRTFHNQDISSWSILKDRTLCPILRDRGVTVKDIKDHPVNLACHKWWQ